MIAKDRNDLQHLLPILDSMLAGRQMVNDKNSLESGEAEIVVFIFDAQIAQSGVVSRMLFDRQ